MTETPKTTFTMLAAPPVTATPGMYFKLAVRSANEDSSKRRWWPSVPHASEAWL